MPDDGHPQFDTKGEDEKLAGLREKEQEDLAEVMSQKYGLTYTDLTVVPVNMDALRTIPESVAKEARAVAFDKNGKQVSLAIENPQNPSLLTLLTDLESQGLTVQKFSVSKRSIDHALSRYADLSLAHTTASGVFSVSKEEFENLSNPLVVGFYVLSMLVVGSRLRSNETLKYKLKLPRPLYRIDADPQSQGRCYTDDCFVAGDSAAALNGLADRLQDIPGLLVHRPQARAHPSATSLFVTLPEHPERDRPRPVADFAARPRGEVEQIGRAHV